MCWVRRRRMKGGRGWIISHRCPWNLSRIWIKKNKYKSLECLWPIWAASDIVHSERQMWKMKSYLMSMTCQKQKEMKEISKTKKGMHKEIYCLRDSFIVPMWNLNCTRRRHTQSDPPKIMLNKSPNICVEWKEGGWRKRTLNNITSMSLKLKSNLDLKTQVKIIETPQT